MYRLLTESCQLTFPLMQCCCADLCLPEVSGLQLIHEITDIPVVVMSCQDSQDSVLQAFEAGAAGYLVKVRTEACV